MGIGTTAMDGHLQIAIKLDDALAWIDAHTLDVEKLIIHLITRDQLKNKGVDKFNEIIGLYSPATEEIDPTKIAGTPFTLEQSGLFYRSMWVTVLKKSILIDAETAHMSGNEWWSTNILGLNEQNLELYKNEIRTNFIKYARKKLGIN